MMWGVGAGAAVLLAIAAGMGDRRRWLRRDLDRVGVVDWRAVQMAALLAAMIMAGLGFHAA
ncbi:MULTISPECIES: hypothetical protein [unclassified Sphingomonas]|uniref:hypothetical protein n=1 Tax=unclassified Sphingomonas TaxID=196159 RepID=UPI002269893C|nr:MULTISPECIES: hypothetical protein [unclassified Sphingomonas]